MQNCRLTGLQNLDTDQDSVQDAIASYLAKLLDMGVYGFRVDAVKHIAAQDVAAIKARLAEKTGRDVEDIFFEQEVIGNGSEAALIQPVNYLGAGKVSEFTYNKRLNAVLGGGITVQAGGLDAIGGSGWVISDKAAVWVANWDTERNGSALTTHNGAKYLLANAFMLACDYGQPHIYSGCYYNDSDDGAPGVTDTALPDMACPTDGAEKPGTWQCAQRWTAIRGMIGFRNAVAGQPVSDWKKYETNVLSVERGSVGCYLAMNNSEADSTQTFATSLPACTYCNVYATGDCSDTVKVATDGTFTAIVSKGSAIAIYAGATPDTWTGTQKYDPSDPDWFTGKASGGSDVRAGAQAESDAFGKARGGSDLAEELEKVEEISEETEDAAGVTICAAALVVLLCTAVGALRQCRSKT